MRRAPAKLIAVVLVSERGTYKLSHGTGRYKGIRSSP
jgi:hypothetical protein